MKHVLAHRDGIALVAGLLHLMGAACHECGFGTRVTSKRWARCKRCGARVQRRTADEASELIDRRGRVASVEGDAGLYGE